MFCFDIAVVLRTTRKGYGRVVVNVDILQEADQLEVVLKLPQVGTDC